MLRQVVVQHGAWPRLPAWFCALAPGEIPQLLLLPVGTGLALRLQPACAAQTLDISHHLEDQKATPTGLDCLTASIAGFTCSLVSEGLPR